MNYRNQTPDRLRRLTLRWTTSESFRVPVQTTIRLARRTASGRDRRNRGWAGRFIRLNCLPVLPVLLVLPVAMIALLAGCSTPAVRQQRLVAQPNMTFSDSAVWVYNGPRLLPQIAPGFPGGDASQNSGCSSCR